MQAFLIALRFAVLMMLLSGLAYPLAVTGLGQLFFPGQANGSLIQTSDGVVVGSKLIGQNFTRPEYFLPRPSVNHYDAANSAGSNLGATNKKLIERVVTGSKTYRATNHWNDPIPQDAVTTSASGLDPHISIANAMVQAPRVAAARKIAPATVVALIDKMTETAFAESPYVNVLQLNLALDRQTQSKHP